MKVEQFYAKNQFIIRDKDKVVFQSYDSIIAIWDGTLTLGKHWDYSTTTSKYLYLFIADYVYDGEIEDVNDKSNKRAYINKLIADGVIKYNKELV